MILILKIISFQNGFLGTYKTIMYYAWIQSINQLASHLRVQVNNQATQQLSSIIVIKCQ